MGHSGSTDGITSLYVKSAENQKYRRAWCERVGTGLEIAAATLPMRATHGRKNVVRTDVHTNPEQGPEPVIPQVTSLFQEPVPPQIEDSDLDQMFFEQPKQPTLEELQAAMAENERMRELMGVK
jgi:hypothetical protein